MEGGVAPSSCGWIHSSVHASQAYSKEVGGLRSGFISLEPMWRTCPYSHRISQLLPVVATKGTHIQKWCLYDVCVCVCVCVYTVCVQCVYGCVYMGECG